MGTLDKSPAVHHGGKNLSKIPKEEKKNEEIVTKHRSVCVWGDGGGCVLEDSEFFLAMSQLFGNIFIKEFCVDFITFFQR